MQNHHSVFKFLAIGLLGLLVLMPACGGGGASASQEEAEPAPNLIPTSEITFCTDTLDNDEDGEIDCDDADCAEDVDCSGASDPLSTNETATLTSESGYCSGGVDDDGDTFIDCDDSDCANDSACVSTDDPDGDGYTVDAGDCNDGDASVYPGATEVAEDDIDQDCDGRDAITRVDSQNIDTADSDNFWVSTSGSDDNDCSFATPCLTMQAAVDKVSGIDQNVMVLEGVYERGFTASEKGVRVYGSVYQDVDDGLWKSDLAEHASVIKIGQRAGGISIKDAVASSYLSALSIVSTRGNPGVALSDASATIKGIEINSKNIDATDNDLAEMIRLRFSTEGKYEVSIRNSHFKFGKIIARADDAVTPEDEAATRMGARTMSVIAADTADILATVTFANNSVLGPVFDANGTSASSHYESITFKDSIGTTKPVTFEIEDNRFVSSASDHVVVTKFSGGARVKMNRNEIRTNSADAVAILSDASRAFPGSIAMTSNVIREMDSDNDVATTSKAVVIAASESKLSLVNNTIVVGTEVNTGYGVSILGGIKAVSVSNNIFENGAANEVAHFNFRERVPTVGLAANIFHTTAASTTDALPVLLDGVYYADIDALVAAGSDTLIERSGNWFAIDPGFDGTLTPSDDFADVGVTPEGMDLTAERDVRGHFRAMDYDGDGTAQVDIGAFEMRPEVVTN